MCEAIKQGVSKVEGKQSVEFYANYKAQWYCLGVLDTKEGGMFKGCLNCERYVDRAKADMKRMAKDDRYRIL